jgi:hypothetical protein
MSAHLQPQTLTRSRVLGSGAIAPRHIAILALALLTTLLLFTSRVANGAVAISVTIAPPALPVYEQPVIPASGYIWVPGYWAYGDEGYYWVPGTWVQPPEAGLLWTPGYWGWSDGAYVWTAGYWGAQVGFYGGIDYGFGYPGHGYEGGYWRDHNFYYNRTVNNISTTNITNVYSKTVVNNVTVNNVSYNGGSGGVNARPTAQEQTAAHEAHHGPTAEQTQHVASAGRQHDLLASVNHGNPPIAATPKPNTFSGAGIVHARGSSAASNAAPPKAGNAPGANEQRQAAQQHQAGQQQQAQQQHQAEQQRQAQEHQAEQPRRLAEAPRTAPPAPQQHEHAAPGHPAPAERTAPAHPAPEQKPKEPPKNEPPQERKPEEGRPQG